MTRDFKTWIRAGWLTDPLLDDRDVILFPEKVGGKFVMMHRPLEWVGPELRHRPGLRLDLVRRRPAGLSAAPSRLLITNKYPWETSKLGVNTPPIKTPHGWFTLYHAVGPDKFYRLGALLLDLDDPSIVLHRTPDWLMQPETDYEIEGFYRGVLLPLRRGRDRRHALRLLRRRRQVLRRGHLQFRGAAAPPASLPRVMRIEMRSVAAESVDPQCDPQSENSMHPSTSPSSSSTCS